MDTPNVDIPELDINYLRIGTKVYAIKEIQNQSIDIDEELRELYTQHISRYSEQFNDGIVNNAVQEWTTQYEHIDRLRARGEVKVPEDMFGKIITIKNNRVLECRAITYAPYQMLGSWSLFRQRRLELNQHWIDVFRSLEVSDTDDIYFDIRPSIFFPLIIAYDPRAEKMYTINMRTFHSHSDRRICCGNHSAQDFWNLPNFEEAMNQINWHSPASDVIEYGDERVGMLDLLNNDTITNIRPRGIDEWTLNS